LSLSPPPSDKESFLRAFSFPDLEGFSGDDEARDDLRVSLLIYFPSP
jgi:hypothetical protein